MNLIFDIQSSIAVFGYIIFAHTRRLGNVLAHNLAKHVSGFSLWMEDIPLYLNNVYF